MSINNFFSFRERSWIAVYTSEELEYAVSLGYSILDTFEIYNFSTEDFIFTDYIRVLAYFKIKYSERPKSSEELKILNEKMAFKGTPLELKMSDFEKKDSLRQHFKLLLNSALGKLAQKPFSHKISYVKSQEELWKLFEEEDIENVSAISEDICQISIRESEKGKKKPNFRTNCILYAFITARSRIRLHKSIMTLQQNKFHVYYCDCDSIFFSGPKNVTPPLVISPAFGDFKNEVPEDSTITNFSCLGRKHYQIISKKEGEKEGTAAFKIRGISLQSDIALQKVSKDYPLKPPHDKSVPLLVPQVRKVHPSPLTTASKSRQISMSRNIICQRKVMIDNRRKTYPWGYNCE